MKPAPSLRGGFTLVELLVSFALLSILLVILSGMVTQTSSAWRFATTKVEEFRSARDGFENITRRLSQATLNTYWDYQYSGSGATQTPHQYIRQSDLRFIIDGADNLIPKATYPRPGHAVFFQAPLGYVDDTHFSGLGNLLNTWGYFVEYNSDNQATPSFPVRPVFLKSLSPPLVERNRYRLMEIMQPSNELNIYSFTSGKPAYNAHDWFTGAFTATTPQIHVVADNAIVLVLLPQLSEEDKKALKNAAPPVANPDLAPAYKYDSTATNTIPDLNPKNQLPPLLQVTMVALDERSAARVEPASSGSTQPPPPDFGLANLFKTSDPNSAANFQTDLDTLQQTLATAHLNYRVFTTTVSIRGAKWSRY